MGKFDYQTDHLTPEEREVRINAAILELERNPNASRRGVARNHGLPESTLRGRMKKLRINYKSFNRDDNVRNLSFSVDSSLSPPVYTPPPSMQRTNLAPTPQHHQQQQQQSQQQQQYQFSSALSNATASSQSMIYAQYYLQQERQAQLLQQQQQHQQHSNPTSVPAPILPPYKLPPLAQVSIVEYHSKLDKNYLPMELDEDSKELKPSTINTQPKRLIQVKVLKNNLIKFDEEYTGTILTETTDDETERQEKIDMCIEELGKKPYLTIRDVSIQNQIPETAIRRTLKTQKNKLVEYCLSSESESKIISILHNFAFVQDLNFFKKLVNDLITDFIKEDYYSKKQKLDEMLDKERREEIAVEFLWKYSDENIGGGFKLQQLID